jgi:hypothetical protein
MSASLAVHCVEASNSTKYKEEKIYYNRMVFNGA